MDVKNIKNFKKTGKYIGTKDSYREDVKMKNIELEDIKGKNLLEVLEETDTMSLFRKWVEITCKSLEAKEEWEMAIVVENNSKNLKEDFETSLLWKCTTNVGVILQTILAGKVGTAELLAEL